MANQTSQIADIKVGAIIEFLSSDRIVKKITAKFICFEKKGPYIDRISKKSLQAFFDKKIAQIKVGTSKK